VKVRPYHGPLPVLPQRLLEAGLVIFGLYWYKGFAMNGFSIFVNRNSDKLMVMFVMFCFLSISWHAYSHGLANFGDALIDLVKQLTAAFLTLVVSKGIGGQRDNGNGNGHSTPAATIGIVPSGEKK
jgi:hypothetical protein